jgi:hypothetical protein
VNKIGEIIAGGFVGGYLIFVGIPTALVLFFAGTESIRKTKGFAIPVIISGVYLIFITVQKTDWVVTLEKESIQSHILVYFLISLVVSMYSFSMWNLENLKLKSDASIKKLRDNGMDILATD